MDEFDLTEWLNSDSEISSPDPATVGSKSVEKTLTTTEVRVLNYVEQAFWSTGQLPTAECVQEELNCSIQLVRSSYKNEVFRNQLAARGIDPDALITVGTVVRGTSVLSAKQIVCANMMLNLHDKRSEREKLALINVSSQQYHAWLRNPTFVEFLRKRGEALFSSSDFEAYKSLVRNVKAGDNKALELFFEMRGIYRKSLDVNINVDVILQRVVEVISIHVKDPKVLNAIANDIDTIIEAEAG